MSYRAGIVTGCLLGVLGMGLVALTWWSVSPGWGKAAMPPLPPAPAVVATPLKEEQINAITLTQDAVDRLALRTSVVERKPMPQSRIYGGEITIPVGQAILTSAPLGGLLKAAPGGAVLPGKTVKKGQVIFHLLPLLTPEGRANLAAAKIDADGQVKTAQTQVEAARIALDRARKVFLSEAGSRRMVDEAQAQFDLTQKTLEAAMGRRDLLEKVVGDIEKGTTAPLAIESPEDGLLRTLSAAAGQNVPAGAALFEVVDLKRLWVRVPVYVGDLPALNPAADAAIGALTMRPGAPQRPAKTTAAPPSANPAAGTVDLYYEIDNRDAQFSPGQRVGALVTIKVDTDSLVVPWSAVVHDIHGGTWVYEQTGDRTFVRRRVLVRRVVGDMAVLAAGPAEKAKVVSAGAAELFGTETGFTK